MRSNMAMKPVKPVHVVLTSLGRSLSLNKRPVAEEPGSGLQVASKQATAIWIRGFGGGVFLVATSVNNQRVSGRPKSCL